MSAYLIIKKNGVTLGVWSRSTEMYAAFDAPFGIEDEFDPEKEFANADEHLTDVIEKYEDSRDTYERMLEGNLTYEERYDTINAIKEINEEIKWCTIYLGYVDFMKQCWECDKYYENPPKWTWVID